MTHIITLFIKSRVKEGKREMAKIMIDKDGQRCFEGEQYSIDLLRQAEGGREEGDIVCYTHPFNGVPLELEIAIRRTGEIIFRKWVFVAYYAGDCYEVHENKKQRHFMRMKATQEQRDTVSGLLSGRIIFEGLKLLPGTTLQEVCPVDSEREQNITEAFLAEQKAEREAERKADRAYLALLKENKHNNKKGYIKQEILSDLLDDDKTGIFVIDPENDYGDFCRAFGGTVLKIGSYEPYDHINPMDMPKEYGLDGDDDINTISMETLKDKAIKKKSCFILSIVECILNMSSCGDGDATLITPQQRTVIDRCLRATYQEYFDHDFDPAYQPTMLDFQRELDKESGESEDARRVAEGMENYTKGNMDTTFLCQTNINVDNRLIVFNIRHLGCKYRQMELIIIFDFIWNRMIENKNRGVRTYCYCDEIPAMFQSLYSADFSNYFTVEEGEEGFTLKGV